MTGFKRREHEREERQHVNLLESLMCIEVD